MAEIKKINTELQPLDKLLDTSGDAGTSGQILTSTGTGTNWVPAATPGTGIYLPLVGGTLTGPLTVGASTDGHDVFFYGDAAGEGMLWDESESRLTINHDTNDSGLDVFTVSSASMTQPQIRVGRDVNQFWGVYTDDRNAHLVHRQDETTGTMTTRFDQWDSNTSDTTGNWAWRSGNGSGGSMSTALELKQSGDAIFTGSVSAVGLNLSSSTGPIITLTDTDASIGVDSIIGHIAFVGTEIGSETSRIASVSETAGGEAGLRFYTGASVTQALQLNKDQNATFAGNVNLGPGTNDAAGIRLIHPGSAENPEVRIQSGESGVSAISIYNTATSPDAEQFFVNNTLGSSHLGNKRGALKLETNSGVVLTLNGTAATFAGNITTLAKVGIGTATPQAFTRLDVRSGNVNGNHAIAGYGYNGVGGAAILGHGFATDNTHAGSSTGIRGISNGSRTVTGSINIGGQFTASGAVSNYAIITTAGNVGINNTTPTFALDVIGTARVSGNTEFPTQSTSDDSSKVATTAFVKNILAEQPAGLSFLGSWDADTNSPTLVSGGGELADGAVTSVAANKLNDTNATFQSDSITVNADRVRVVQANGNIAFSVITTVNSDTQLTLTDDIATAVGDTYIVEKSPFLSPEGGYYIVGTSGDENLNGITDWVVGDWALIATTNVFQKIDNTSVLSGSGNGGSVAGWTGSGTSVALGDAPITFSGNSSTFAGGLTGTTGTFSGNVNVSGDIEIDNSSGDPFLKLKTAAQEYVLRIDQSDSEKFQIRNTTSSVTALSIDTSSDATFVGKINLSSNKSVDWGGGSIRAEGNTLKLVATTLIDLQKNIQVQGDVTIAEASNKGQLFFGTANTDYEIKGGGNYGYLSLNATILRFDTGGTEKMRIDGNGVLQLTSDIDGYLNANTIGMEIDINRNPETGTFKDTGLSHARIIMRGDTTANGGSNIKFVTSPTVNTVGTTKMTITGAGNVGIGTINPNKTLELGYSNTEQSVLSNGLPGGAAGTGVLVFNTDTSTTSPFANIDFRAGNADARIAIQRAGDNSSNFHFITDNANTFATKMFLKHNGQFGLGTVSPVKNIELSYSNSSTDVLGNLAGAGTGGGVLLRNIAGTGYANIDFRVNDADGRIAYKWEASNTGNFHFITDNAGTIDTKMFIKHSGDVGIGTTSPDSLLELQNSPAAQTQTRLLHIDNNPASNQGSGYMEISSGTNNQAKTQIEQVSSGGFGLLGNQYLDTNIINKALSASTHGNINFATGSNVSNTSIVMTIGGGSQKGNVGIGTTSPASKLEVNGNVTISEKIIHAGDTNTFLKFNSGGWEFQSSGGPTTDISASGGVTSIYGKGTEAIQVGSSQLANFLGPIYATNSLTAALNPIAASGGDKALPAYSFISDTNTGMYSDTADQLEFVTGGDVGMVIDSSSNVGIGTNGPEAKLHVYNGDASIAPNGDGDEFVIENNGNAGMSILTGSTSNGAIFFGDAQDNNIGIIDYDHNVNKMSFTVAASKAITINASRNVGIGNTNPGNKLEVTGIIEATVGDTGGFAYGANPPSKQGLMISVSNTGGDAFSGAGRIENTSTTNSSSAVLVLRQTNSASFSTITQYRQGSGTQGNLVGFVRVTTTNTIFSTSGSDERLKKNITNWTDDTLGKFKALQPKKFRYKIQDASEEKTLGFIAQNEVANFPEAYVLNKENEDDDAMYSFNPMGMTTHLMKGMKDLIEKVEALEKQVEDLKSKI